MILLPDKEKKLSNLGELELMTEGIGGSVLRACYRHSHRVASHKVTIDSRDLVEQKKDGSAFSGRTIRAWRASW
jgi:hypothetical protein